MHSPQVGFLPRVYLCAPNAECIYGPQMQVHVSYGSSEACQCHQAHRRLEPAPLLHHHLQWDCVVCVWCVEWTHRVIQASCQQSHATPATAFLAGSLKRDVFVMSPNIIGIVLALYSILTTQ